MILRLYCIYMKQRWGTCYIYNELTLQLDYETSSPAPTIANSSSASKKRKVGRPRKLMCNSGSARHLTETIVAKKPKSKSSLVGYLMASKSRHLQNKVTTSRSTPRQIEPVKINVICEIRLPYSLSESRATRHCPPSLTTRSSSRKLSQWSKRRCTIKTSLVR